MNILSIGNSFSADTMRHIAEIAKSAGMTDFTFANLYIGGCSINRHYDNVLNDVNGYRFHVNKGDGWNITNDYSVSSALKECKWDIINIQHGTGDKSRYTSPESYVNLAPLVKLVKEQLDYEVKISFNMAWVAEPESTHHEITSYGGDQLLMYNKLTELTKNVVSLLPEIDIISPAGTAIQNMRGCVTEKLTSDNFHLNHGLGCYIAGLTFLKALCNIDLEKVDWAPEDVTEQEKAFAKKSTAAAIANPYGITIL